MAIEEYKDMMARCARCSYCKWIPFANVQNWRFAKGCPSVEYNKFQSYSAGGRLAASLSLLEGRSEATDGFLKIAYSCLMDGLCDVSCKVGRYNMEPLEAMKELRFKLVGDGQLLLQHQPYIRNLRKEDNMVLKPRSERGKWAEGLDVKRVPKDSCEVLFHAGCRYSYDENLWKALRGTITLLKNAGVDIGILGESESCCAGRVCEWGYEGEFIKFAENNMELWKNAKVKTIVTSCAECYYSFNRLYPPLGSKIEVLHSVQYVDRLMKEGKINFKKEVPLQITYHDPCHLGRRGEPYIPWNGKEKKIRGQIITYEPKKPRYTGAQGVYDIPRNILKSIPGVELVEMTRNKEFAWCCGAGGGVNEAFPDFGAWTAKERIEEAVSTGARALVTACPGCIQNLSNAVKVNGQKMEVFDVIELVQKAI